MKELFEQQENRVIRVFISSTFRDMMEEREYLIKNVFPEIKNFCKERRIEFTEVDLRWGVTAEEASQGKVIHICLSEIDKSRPYFIGILGDRYGWVPTEEELKKYKQIISDFSWVKNDIKEEISITEMEIQYGVLRNISMDNHAFFYLKEPTKIPSEITPEFQKLSNLKKTIRSLNRYIVKDYHNLHELGEYILKDFRNLIDKKFPKVEELNFITRTRLDHGEFLKSRLNVYIRFKEYDDILDAHFSSDSKPLVITGKPGIGKSALIANWLVNFHKKNPETFILYHSIGGGKDSTNYISILNRLLQEINFQFNLLDDIPSDPEIMANLLPQFLANSVGRGRWILILDGINQLESIDNARFLSWLPIFFPTHIRVIFSTLEGEVLDVLKRRDYPLFEVKSLNKKSRMDLIREFLFQYSKKLPESTVKRIANDNESENPLILRTLLDELRMFGLHESLEERINYYLQTNSYEEFFDAVLKRMEEDYEPEHKGMVGELLSCVWASKHGISENEILEVSRVPKLYWSPLYNALNNHLILKYGLLSFSHDFLRQSVEKRYMNNDETKKVIYQKLADFFQKDKYSERCLGELPHILINMKDFERLKNYLADLKIFQTLFIKSKNELTFYWKHLKDFYSMGDVYKEAVNGVEPDFSLYNNLGLFLQENSLFDDSLYFFHLMFKFDIGRFSHFKKWLNRFFWKVSSIWASKEDDLSFSGLNNIGTVYHYKGDIQQSIVYFKLARAYAGSKTHNLSICYNNLGRAYQSLEKYKEAMEFYNKSLQIRIEILGKNHLDVATVYNNIGDQYQEQGLYDKSLENHLEAIKIRKHLVGENHIDTGYSYHNIAMVYASKRDYDKALEYNLKALDIFFSVYGEEHHNIVMSYNNIGNVYLSKKKYVESLQYFQKALHIGQKIFEENNLSLAYCYNSIAMVHLTLKEYEKAKELLHKTLKIRQNAIGDNSYLIAMTYGNLANTYEKLGLYNDSIKFYNKAIEGGKNHPEIEQESRQQLENLLSKIEISEKLQMNPQEMENYDLRLKLYIGHKESWMGVDSQERNLYEELRLHLESGKINANLLLLYNQIGLLNKTKGDYEKAFDFYTQGILLWEYFKGTDNASIYELFAQLYNNTGNLCVLKHDPDRAIHFLDLAIDIKLILFGEQHTSTAISYDNLGKAYCLKKEYQQALNLHSKAVHIYKNVVGDLYHMLPDSYNNIGDVFRHKKQYDTAREYYNLAYEIAEKVDKINPMKYAVPKATLENNIGNIYYDQNKFKDAILHYEEAYLKSLGPLGKENQFVKIYYDNLQKAKNKQKEIESLKGEL